MAWRCVNGLIIQLSYLLSTTATPALFNYGCENTRFVFAEGSRVVGLLLSNPAPTQTEQRR